MSPAQSGQLSGPLDASKMKKGYDQLAKEPGGWVSMTDLRSMFPDASKAEFDKMVKDLDGQGATAIPESNQKMLTTADRAAAVNIGGEPNHLFQMGTVPYGEGWSGKA